jgi:hypothetical protein
MIDLPKDGITLLQTVRYASTLWKDSFSRTWLLSFLIALINILPFMLYHIHTSHTLTLPVLTFTPWFVLMTQLLLTLGLLAALYHQLVLFKTAHQPTLKDSFIATLKRYPRMLIASVLFSIVTCAGLMFLIFPGLFIFVAAYFFLPLMMLTNTKLIMSFVESVYLVTPYWWRSAIIILVPSIALELCWISIKDFMLTFPFSSVLMKVSVNAALTTVLIVFSFLIIPWVLCLFSVHLFDLLNRDAMDVAAEKQSS